MLEGFGITNKRKTIFSWIQKQYADIPFLQETYSTPEVVENWRFQWKGKMYYSHGTNHSKGVLILISDKLQFELKSITEDNDGRYVLIDALIQDSPFLLEYILPKHNIGTMFVFL